MDSGGRAAARGRIATLHRADHDATLLVIGDEGSGKSRLLETLAGELGAVLIRVNPVEASWPLSGLSTVFASLGDPRVAEFSGRFHLRSTDPDEIYAAAQDLLRMLRGLGLPRMTLLVDDIDRMDAESRALIGAMAPRLAGTGIRLAASSRPLRGDDPFRGLDAVRLDALDDDAAFALIAGAADPATDEGTLRILVRQSSGNPGALLEALHSLTIEQLRGREPLLLPLRRSREWGAARALSPAERAILETVSLAPVTPVGLLRSVGVQLDAIDDLIGDRVLATTDHAVRIADPLLRSLVHWTIDPERRRLRHRELALAARRSGAAAVAAWHSSFTTPRNAATVLRTAAAYYARSGDTRSAIEFSERARRIDAPGREDLAAVLDLAAGLDAALEPALAARALLQIPAGEAPAPLALRAAAIAAVIRFRGTERVSAGDFLDALGALRSEAPDEAVEGIATLAALHDSRWESAAARELLGRGDEQLANARRGIADYHRAVSSLTDALDGRPIADPVAAVARVREADEPDERIDQTLLILGRTMSIVEDYEHARHTFAIVGRPSAPAARSRRETALMLTAQNDIRQGDGVRAQESIAQWLEIADGRPRSSSRILLEAWYAFAREETEAWRSLAKLCLQRAAAERNLAVSARLRALQGEIALFAGDVESAERTLRAAAMAAEQIRNPQLVRHGADLVHALLRAGRLREAEAAAAELQSRRRHFPSRWLTLAAARAAALVAPLERSVALHDEVAAMFTAEDSPIELAKTLLGRADAERRTGRAAEQTMTLTAVATLLEHAGARAWMRGGGAPEERPARWDTSFGLTPEEVEVVRLLRRGYHNKEIAGALYVSLRTVELRLTRVFRKTGATTRAELTALLDRPSGTR